MTDQPPSLNYQTSAAARPANGLGLAGFIISLIGLFTCGLLAPVGLFLSAFGMRRQPRGLATAGTVIGIVGILELLSVVGVTLWAVYVAHAAVATIKPFINTQTAVEAASRHIIDYRTANAGLPDDAAAIPLIATDLDGWGHALRYHKLTDAQFEIRSPGRDGTLDTPDDQITTFDDAGAVIPPATPPSPASLPPMFR